LHPPVAVRGLDCKATGITPLCIRRSGTVSTGTGVLVIGHPATLPQKIAGGAMVKGVGSSYFEADLDAYGGNSGSPLLDAADADCDDSNPCSEDRCISSACSHTPANAGSICRPATGACGSAEACDGLSIDCPSNRSTANGTSCGGAGGSCAGGLCRQ
jgi:hypothetical protein